MNVPPFDPACLTPQHKVSAVRAGRTLDLDSAIRARVQVLAGDPALVVLGCIRLNRKEAVIVSQVPLSGDVAITVMFKDKGAR